MRRITLIALVFIFLIAAVGLWVLSKNETTTPPVLSEQSETRGIFKGYYEEIVRPGIASDGIEPRICNTFVVEEGHSELLAYFKNLVSIGNTVNTVDPYGRLRINLPWNELSDSDRTTILASTPDQPIVIELQKKIQAGKGTADRCFSFFSIIRVL